MVTKLKNDHAIIGSIIGILIAVISISYCFSYITDLFGNTAERTSRVVSQLVRLIKGGV